jgi:hypothetical protein
MNRTNPERGQSIVETTFIFLVCFAVLVGILDVGQSLFLHETLVERARNAARWATVNPMAEAAVRNIVLFGQAAAPSGETPFWGLKPEDIQISYPGCSPRTSDCRVVVAISGYKYNFFSAQIVRGLTGQGSGESVLTGLAITASVPYEMVQ